MGVREKHRIDIGGPKGKTAVIELLECLLPLEQAAIDQEAAGGGLEQVARASHGAGGAAKSNGDAHVVVSGKGVLLSDRRAAARISSSAIALVGCGTLSVERTERMPASLNAPTISGGNRACVTIASMPVAPAASSAFAATINVAPEETMSSTSSA